MVPCNLALIFLALLALHAAAESAESDPATTIPWPRQELYPFSLQVYQVDPSNLVFVVSNISSTPISLPQSNYAISGSYTPATNNFSAGEAAWELATNDESTFCATNFTGAEIGLWLTDDWRYMGGDWFLNMSMKEKLARLAPTKIKPKDSILVRRKINAFENELLSSPKVAKKFNFNISLEAARKYGLTAGNATTTNFVPTNWSSPKTGNSPTRSKTDQASPASSYP
jgi:hypothetical protein